MWYLQVTLLFVINLSVLINTSDVFHVNSKITFYPDLPSDYFGYAVLLSDMGFHVGAPKAKSRTIAGASPGAVFTCPLDQLDMPNVTCHPIADRNVRSYLTRDFFRHDMWFGATIAAAPDNKLLVCAPRITVPYQSKHLLANGACYVLGKDKEIAFFPLKDEARQAFKTDGSRKEYGEYGTHLNYYAYGQSGFSMVYTRDNHVVIGAPGVLQWTGAIVDYNHTLNTYKFEHSPSTNPYNTKELGPDDYFGYSVESGVFEVNGTVLHVAGAPRSGKGYGQVLIYKPSIIEKNPLDIKAKLRGPQLGCYFGAALSTADINGDGVSDLLVGAPNFVARSNGELTFDQGAVFVYITRKSDTGFILEEAGSARGSGESGARFGTAIADLGDIDGDGYTDIAIGAPWENNGAGVVYIYRGTDKGLSTYHHQRIYADGARSFGVSVAKGYDVDKNRCNDLAIGAHNSGTAYIYRSIPTIQVMSAIKVPDAKNLRQDATSFNALFCITAPPNKLWGDVEIKLRATVTVDPEGNRAFAQGDTDMVVTVKPGVDRCDEQIIEVNNQSDLSQPIKLNFELKPLKEIDDMLMYPEKTARLSETSILTSSFLIQLLSDCGSDLICTPWLQMTLEPLDGVATFVPGSGHIPGVKIKVTNLEEPAYSVQLHVVLPSPPIRLDSSCSLQNLDLTCDLPAPLKRNQTAEWIIQLEYSWDGAASELMIAANLEDPLYMRKVSEGAKELIIPITPQSSYNYSGKTESNSTVVITRETFARNEDVFFTHYYEITNQGPSDLYNIKIEFLLSQGVSLASTLEGAIAKNDTLTLPLLNLKANATTAYHLPLRFNLTQYGYQLEENDAWNVTSAMTFYIQYGSTKENRTIEVTTTLNLEPATPIWPLIVGLIAGLLVLAAIILALYKFGFFSRQKKEDLKQLLETTASQEDPGSSSNMSSDTEGQSELLSTE